MSNESIGIFGGTFDPIHIGHLITAQAVKEIRNLKEIIFIPAFTSPHKTEKNHTASLQRLEMLKLAIQEISYFNYSDLEIKTEEVSFTVNTLKELKQQYHSIELIIGYDNLITFNTWKDPDKILDLAKLIVLKRGTEKNAEEKNKYFDKAVFVQTPVIEISATEIRNKVRQNLPIDFLVPDKVNKYIYKNKLYLPVRQAGKKG